MWVPTARQLLYCVRGRGRENEPGTKNVSVKQSNLSWAAAAILSVVLAITAANEARAEAGGDPQKPRGVKELRNIVVRAGVEAATKWLAELVEQRTEPDTHAGAHFFEIPEEEYQRWPEGRRRVVQAVYATRETFHKRTIALMKTLETEDWELIERAASYVVVPTGLLSREGLKGSWSFDELGVDDEVELEAMGIIGSASVFGTSRRLGPNEKERLYKAIRFDDHAIVLHFKNADHGVDWPITPITKVGQEIFPLLQRVPNLVTPDWNYVRALGKALAEKGITVELWEVSDGRDAKTMKPERRIWAIPGTP